MISRTLNKVWSATTWIGHREFLLMLLWSLWLAFPYFGFGDQSYVRLHDCGDFSLPFAMIQGSWLAHLNYWWWNSLPICGVDSLPSGQPPLKLDVFSSAVLPPWVAYAFLMWLQRFVAGYFTFRLARDVLQVSLGPSLFAGLSYSLFSQGWLNGAWAGFTLYDLLLLPGVPFILWALSKRDPQNIGSHIVALALGVFFSICSHYKYTIFFFPLLGYWFLRVTPRKDFRFWLMIVFFGTGYIMMEAPVLWATYLYAPLSHRAQWVHFGADSFISQSMGIRFFVYQVGELVRDNALPLLFLFLSLAILRRLPRQASSLIKISICIVAFQAAWLLGLPVVQDRLGFLVGFNFERFYLYLPFLLTICGAMCLESIDDSWRLGLLSGSVAQRSWKLKTLLIVVAVGVVTIQSLLVQGQVILEAAEGNNFANFYRHRAFELVATKKDEVQPFRVATVVESFRNCPHPDFSWAYALESIDGYVNIYSRRYQEYWGAVLAPLTAANNRIRSYFWSWGCRVYLFSPNFFTPAASQASEKTGLTFSDYYSLNLLSLGNARYIVSPIPLHDKDLQLILSPTAEQIAWKSNPSRFDKVISFLAGKPPGFALYVYENLLALPRFSLMGKVLVFENKNEILEALGKADPTTLSANAFVMASDIRGVPLEELRGAKGDVIIREYGFDKIRLTTHSESACILFTANNWSPYWKAWVNGVETKMFPVDHTFQGVYCPAGYHEVLLRYIP